jgi:hypothetical protein
MPARTLLEPLESRTLRSATIPFTPVAVQAEAGTAFTATLDRLPTLQVTSLSQLHGDVTWGDGTNSPATFTRDPAGGIDVLGTHAFATAGTYGVSVGLTETAATTPGQPTPLFDLYLGTVSTTATVLPAAATGATLTETAAKRFTAVLGSFTQFTLDVTFTGVIHWGDGHSRRATLTGGDLDQGVFTVTGTHAYARAGTYQVRTTIYSHVVGSKLKPTAAFELLTTIQVARRA